MDISAVLVANYPDCSWRISGDQSDYANLDWRDDAPKPTKDELEAAWPAVRDARAWAQVRAERDRLLSECDWTQVADAPLTASEKEAWADYRQALRDIPQTQDDPDDIVWPEVP